MFKSSRKFKRVFSVLTLVAMLTVSSFTVSAVRDTKPETNEELVHTIINDKDTKAIITETADGYRADVVMDFHIKDAEWTTIQSLTDPIELKFPDSMRLSHKEALKFTNTDKNFEKGVSHQLEDTRIIVEENSIIIDFKDMSQRPEDFRLVYELDITNDMTRIEAIDTKLFPVVSPIIEDILAFMSDETPSTNEVSEEDVDDTEIPPLVIEDDNASEEDDQTEKTEVSGQISLELKGNPQARIKRNNQEINDSNPIDMNLYSETSQDYAIDLYTDENPDHLGVSYIVRLDDASLNLITEANKTNALNFKYIEDGVQVPFKYEYAFPEMIKFYDQTGDSILASTHLSEYSTSAFKRLNPGTNEGFFKLDIEEIKIDPNLEGAQVQYKFQDYISIQISKYVNDELQAGKSLEEIKTALKEGVEVSEDAYKFSDYRYQQRTKSSFEKLENYPVEINNILNSNKDIHLDLPVIPMNGIDHKLEAESFEQISNGFELKWEGIINTNRKSNMETIELAFDVPSIVKTSGFSEWEIKTIVDVSYYDVLNDGTRVPSSTQSDETLEFLNVSSDKVDTITIDTHGENHAVVYKVNQVYTNTNLNLEIEGKQIGRLTSTVNKTQFKKQVENEKEFPRSIIINGIKGAEGSPTSLHWDVVFNNNQLVRQPNDGFNFYLDPSSIKAYRYSGGSSGFEAINVAFNQMKIKTTIYVDGKTLEDDGRFSVAWNADFTEAKIRLKSGLSDPLDKEVKFQFKYEIDVKEEYAPGRAIRDELLSSSKLKFEGSAAVKSFTNGIEIEPSTPTPEEIEAQKSLNYLVILDKRPVMIDYRTKEVIWAVAVNTVTAHRVGLEGLTYSDTFKSSGMYFEPMDEDHPILMFKVDPDKIPQTTHPEYSKFISEVKKIMDDSEIYSDGIAEAIVGSGGLLEQVINEEAETPKTYGEIISYVNPSEIAYLKDSSATLTNEKFALSLPKVYPGYTDQLKGKVVNGEPGDPFESSPTKSDLLKNADIRIDFIESNKAIGPAEGEDDNAYYIMYKTKLSSDTPMESVKNAGALTFSTWQPGEGNTITWTGGDVETSKDLGEVAKYNTVPKKEGTVKVINDETSGRQRLVANWEITFNYDVETRPRLDEAVPMVVIDTIDKTRDLGGYSLGNKHLTPQDIDEIVLTKFKVDKEGNLVATDETEIVTKASGELVITETDSLIEYSIKKDLSPKYVYRFEINTFIESHEAIVPEPTEDVSNISLTGEFENSVSYTRGHEPNQIDLPEPGIATTTVEYGTRNRVQKTGTLVPGSYPGSRQQVQWTLSLNDTYENMSNIVIKDELESKHTFKFIKNPNDLEQSDSGGAILDRFSIQEYSGGSWRNISSDKYTLTNIEGDANKPLDNWTTGESGFILSFNQTMSNPIRIQYATFGHVVDNKELPLKNHVDLRYSTDTPSDINHKVTSDVTFRVNDEAGGYDDERFDLGLTMRYNENQPTLPTELDKGVRITGNNVDQSVIILYRYQNNFVENNHIYRIGKPDANGYLEFKNIEKGNYIIKQYNVADGYSVPNSLGYVDTGRNTTKDKSVEINSSQLASGNLVTLNVQEPGSRFANLWNRDTDVTKIDYAIYNHTPVFEVTTKGKLLNASGSSADVNLENIQLDISDEHGGESTFMSDAQGTFKVGAVNSGDTPIDFGKFDLTQGDQQLNGYLRNTETIHHVVNQNPNGTVDATSTKTSFNNYKTSVSMKVVQRGTDQSIANSSYTLERFDGSDWVAYYATSSQKGTDNVYNLNNGILSLHNLDTGRYRLKQTAVGDDYLINTDALEFYVYGPSQAEVTESFEGKPPVMQLQFDNLKASVNVINSIGTDKISGSSFEIRKSDNTVVDTFTITDKDAGYTQDLAPGTYKLVQTGTTDNRPLNQTPMTFVIETTEGMFEDETILNTRTLVFENHLGSFVFDTHTPSLDTFNVTRFELDYDSGSIQTTRQNNLGSGSYEVKDMLIDSEWIHVLTDYTFSIPQNYTNPETLKQTVHIYGTKSNLAYANRDGDVLTNTTQLNGSIFELTNKSTNTQVPTHNEGQQIIDISPGTYTLSQTVAPDNYGLNTAVLDGITVPSTLTQTDVAIDTTNHSIENYDLTPITFYNYRGKVVLTKQSAETQSPLKDITFHLFKDGIKLDGEYITDDQGKINVDLLSPGNYYFEEIKGDGEHIVNANKTPFTIAASHENAYDVQEVEVSNYYANLIFKNTNPSRDVIYTDGTFTLYEEAKGTWTPVGGFVNFKVNPGQEIFEIFGVKAGSYKLVQTQGPESTVRNTFEYLFEIPEYSTEEIDGRVTIELDDYINYQATLNVDVVDPNGAFIGNVDASITNPTGTMNPLNQKSSTLTQTGMGSGSHKIHVNAVDSAIIVDESLEVQVPESALNDEGLHLTQEIRVTYARHQFRLKDGRTDSPLYSGVLSVNGTNYRFDQESFVSLNDLTPGIYSYEQTEAALGYVLNTLNKGTFEVYERLSDFDPSDVNMDGFPYVKLQEKTLENYQHNVVVNKVDEKGTPLEGVEFTLSGTSGNAVATTNDKGQAIMKQLAPGQYVLKETKPLNGYQALTDTYSFEAPASHPGKPDDIIFKVTNKKILDPKLPSTGMSSNLPWLAIGLASIGLVFIVISRRRKYKK